jgi:hypothetical protein
MTRQAYSVHVTISTIRNFVTNLDFITDLVGFLRQADDIYFERINASDFVRYILLLRKLSTLDFLVVM